MSRPNEAAESHTDLGEIYIDGERFDVGTQVVYSADGRIATVSDDARGLHYMVFVDPNGPMSRSSHREAPDGVGEDGPVPVLRDPADVIAGERTIERGSWRGFMGNDQVIFGDENMIRGNRCYVYGHCNYIIGDDCHVFGKGNQISGRHCEVIGENNTVIGPNCSAFGRNNIARGDRSRAEEGDPMTRPIPMPPPLLENAPRGDVATSVAEASLCRKRCRSSSRSADEAKDDSEKPAKIVKSKDHQDVGSEDDDEDGIPGFLKTRFADKETGKPFVDDPATSETDRCLVCMENKKVLMVTECKHVCFCFACAKKFIDQPNCECACPLCKIKITKKMIRVYI